MRTRLFIALALAAAPAALAGKPAPLFEDHGAIPPNDPYHHDTQTSVGRMEGFRRLYVDPATWPDQLEPASASGAKADLVIPNPTSAWVKVSIGGTEIGQVRPFDVAAIHGVKGGTYEIRFELPNRYSWTETVTATAP
jgi:hypothetical protein